jgi:hypothetical protein
MRAASSWPGEDPQLSAAAASQPWPTPGREQKPKRKKNGLFGSEKKKRSNPNANPSALWSQIVHFQIGRIRPFSDRSPQACRDCALRSRCTTNAYRQISRWVHEAVLDRLDQRLNAKPEMLKVRRQLAEHPFGSIKQWMNQGAFLMRGLEKVRAEFSLTALAYNLTRVLNILGVATLLQALKTV